MIDLTIFPNNVIHKSSLCVCLCHEWQDGAPKSRCDHKWDGPIVTGECDSGSYWESASCSICGLTAMGHDMWLF